MNLKKDYMKRFLLFLTFISAIILIADTELQMSNASELEKRLAAFSPLIENTYLIQNLAGKKVYPLHVYAIVENAFGDFDTLVTDAGKKEIYGRMYCQKDHLLKIILRDHQEALQELKNCGILR